MKSRLFILDPAIRNTTGHYLSYAHKIAVAADSLGLTTWIITHVDVESWDTQRNSINIVPFFDKHVWDEFEEERDGRDSKFQAASMWIENAIRQLHQRFQFVVDDHLLWPTVTPRQFPGLVSTFTASDLRHIHAEILIRYQSEWYQHPAVMAALRRLERMSGRIVLSTDSQLLSQELGVLTSLPVAVRPIPHVHDEAAGLLLGTSGGIVGPLVISMLGNAREEKGFVLLLQALPLISAVYDGLVPLRFVIQCNEPDLACREALNQYTSVQNIDVEWIREAISDEEYDLRVAQSALVLAPYDEGVYRARTSGIGLDALLHGVPIIATGGTWLSRVLPRSAILELRERSVAGLASAILEAVAQIDELTRQARIVQPSIARTHNAVAFVRQAVGMDSFIQPEPRTRRALVIYPWGNASSAKAGNSSRVHMLVDYLERNGHSVRLVAAGGEGTRIGRQTWIEAHDTSTWGRIGWPGRLVAVAEVLLSWLGGGHNEIKHIVSYFNWRADHCWRNRLSEAIRWADDVYLEYPFFADLVRPLAAKHRSQVWLTNHDIVHAKLENGLPKHILASLEINANRSMHLRACVTGEEQHILKVSGIHARVIENVTRASLAEWAETDDPHLIVTRLIGRDSREVGILMFVGSHYGPNIHAARAVRRMAERFEESGVRTFFVVAGGCWVREATGNFVSVGEIDAVSLHALYAVASLVLNPVQEGSGSAVKMLEALAHGKCIISTSVGARGHDLQDGVECVIEDDLNAFPARIERWLRSSPEKSAMELRARRRALANDYMAVFPKYATHSNAQWHGGGLLHEVGGNPDTVDYTQLLATPSLASDPVIVSLVKRRGVPPYDLATRRLQEKLEAALRSPIAMPRQSLRALEKVPEPMLVRALIATLLSVPVSNKENLGMLVSSVRGLSRSERDRSTQLLFDELWWLLDRLDSKDFSDNQLY